MNATATEIMLAEISRDIRRMMADIGILCNECNRDITDTLASARDGLERADTEVRYAAYIKKHREGP